MIKITLSILVLLCTRLFSQCVPSVKILVSNGLECPNNNFILTAKPTFGGINPTYIWKLNGKILDNTHPDFNTPILPANYKYLNGDIITCVMISNDTCVEPNFTSATDSHTINYYTLNSKIELSVYPSGTVSKGTSVTFTGLLNNPYASRFYYQFYKNGKAIPLDFNKTYNNSSGTIYGNPNKSLNHIEIFVKYSDSMLKNGDTVYLKIRNANVNVNFCGVEDTSNNIVMSVGKLPITLSKFSVKPTRKTFILEWITEKEQNMKNFEVQVSANGNTFLNVGQVHATGNSYKNKTYTYKYVPTSISNKTFYLRLKMIEKNGTITYSSIEKAELFQFSKIDSISVAKKKLDTLLKLDSFIDSAIKSKTDTIENHNNSITSLEIATKSYQDSISNTLIIRYLLLFDKIYQGNEYLLNRSVVDSIETPEDKIKFLITYCLLSNIMPTRSAIEECLLRNPCFLFQKKISLKYNISSPLPFKISKKEIKKLLKEYYQRLDSIQTAYMPEYIDKKNTFLKTKNNWFKTAAFHLENGFFDEIPIINSNRWKIAFYVSDMNGNEVKNSFSVSYHPYKLESYKVDNASLAFAELPPGDIYLDVTRNNSDIPLKIKEHLINVKKEIDNAKLEPERRVINYFKNKALSRENIFIIFIHLLQ